jgi:hypothetical protein
MARHKHRRKKDKKAPYYDPPLWVEGHILNEKTGKLEPVRYKLRNRCNYGMPE